MLPQEMFWILTPSSPLSWVSESFRWDIGQFNSPRIKHLSNPFSRFQPGKFFLLKIYLLWKIWPISVKRWKPVWVRACLCTLLWSVRLCSQSSMAPHQRRPAFTRRETSGRLYFLSWSQKSSTVPSEPNFGPPPPPRQIKFSWICHWRLAFRAYIQSRNTACIPILP